MPSSRANGRRQACVGRRWRLAATVVVSAAVMAACGSGSYATATPIRPTRPAAAPGPPSEVVFPGPTPTAVYPPGVTVLDRAFSFGAVEWSSDGTAAAAEGLGQTVGTGTVDVFSADGARLASIPGSAFGWLDATDLLVHATTPGDAASGTVALWGTDGRLVEELPGRFGGLLANGQGAALLRRAPPAFAYGGNDFQFWARGRLGPMISGAGIPAAWSPDGRLVALTQSTATVRAADGVALASTGGPLLGFLHVLRYPDATEVGSFGDHPINLQGGVAFSRDSRYVAAGNFGAEGVLVFDLTTGRVTAVSVAAGFWRWAPDGSLAITEPDGTTLLWRPDGTLAASGFQTGYPVWGPAMDDVAVLPQGQPPGLEVTVRTPSADVSVSVGSGGPGFPVAWAPDGSSCLLTTGSTTPGVPDELLRVALR